METVDFREALLQIMERKQHWAWSAFGDGTVPKELLHHHFEQEFEVYVRDFPVLIGWAYVQCPIAAVRQELAENLYEEETGGISQTRPHPELFLRYPKGLGMNLERFEAIELFDASVEYREFLDEACQRSGWEVAAAITTLWLEGTRFERGELDETAPKRPEKPLEEHPLVVHYGLPLESLALTKTHRAIEGSHRAAAWRLMLDHVGVDARPRVVEAMEQAVELWLRYRDAVADACGLERNPTGRPRRLLE